METLLNPPIAEDAAAQSCAEASLQAPRAAVEGSLVAATSDAGSRLDASWAADRQWRTERVEKLQCGLRSTYRLAAVARAGCVLGGLIDVVFVAGQVASWTMPDVVPGHVGWFTFPALVGVLAVSGLLAVSAAGRRWRLLRGAQREVVAVPREITPTYQALSTAEPAEREWARRCNQVQQELSWAHRDEQTMGKLCLWAGYVAVVTCLLMAVAMGLGWLVGSAGMLVLLLVYLVALLPWLAVIIVLPFAAVAHVYQGERRKGLLRSAAEEELVVSDPARCPWD